VEKIKKKFKEVLQRNCAFIPQELQERLIVLSKNKYFLILLNIVFAFVFVVVVNLIFVDIHSIYFESEYSPPALSNRTIGFIYVFFELVFIGSFYVSIVKIALYFYTLYIIKIPLDVHGVLLKISASIGNLVIPFHIGNFFILLVICEIVINLFKIRLWTIFALIRIISVVVLFRYL
jgi:hypothetical protein